MGNHHQKRVFRIEKYIKRDPMLSSAASAHAHTAHNSNGAAAPLPINDFSSDEQHQEILAQLGDIKSLLQTLNGEEPASDLNGSSQTHNTMQAASQNTSETTSALSDSEIEEARRLRAELKEIYDAIEETKKEILTIHQSGVNGMEISRVTDELGAIVAGTERATEGILAAAEHIDQNSADLTASLTDETLQGLSSDIQDHVVGIFEACNFQDLTGQRITKVVSAFRFIEERVIHMMEIWGGVDSFDDIEPEELEHRKGDGALLNGPALEEDEDIASQDDIDALFA